MKKQNLTLAAVIKRIAKCSIICVALFSVLLVTGCSMLTYSGDDYDPKNSLIVQTNEAFVFSTYNKNSQTEGIDMRVGVSKTPLPEALVAYVLIKNNSAQNDYIFYTKDFKVSAQGKELSVIPPSMFIAAYQGDQTGSMAAMQAIAPTLTNIANISSNYQTYNQSTPLSDQQNSVKSSTKQITDVAKGITNHSINNAAVLKPLESRFFYIFVKTNNIYPIDINYKDLTYSFMTKSDVPEEE